MKEGNSTILGSQRLPQTRCLFSRDKSASRAENGCRTVRRLRKTAVAGRNRLAKPLPEKKIADDRPTDHEHEPKWVIPVNIRPSRGFHVLILFCNSAMVDVTKTKIRSLFVHWAGNKLRQEGCIFSAKLVLSPSDELSLFLFFLAGFRKQSFSSFPIQHQLS
jgi:hypothetical protein